MTEAYFDRELSVSERRQLFNQLSGKGGRCEDLARMQRILAQLRLAHDEIDVAGEVLAQVSRRRSFLSPAMRSAIRMGRMAVAASVLLALLGIVIVQRLAPDATSLVAETTPVTSLMQNTGSELARIKSTLASVPEQAFQVLSPRLSQLGNGADQSPEIRVGVVAWTNPQSPTSLVAEHAEILVLSGAADALFAQSWSSGEIESAPQGFALESVSIRPQGFRTVESRVILFDLAARVEGKRARVVPYYVEHFEAGALPVSFDPDVFKDLFGLISRTSELPNTSLAPDR